jgi:hypothetical protein
LSVAASVAVVSTTHAQSIKKAKGGSEVQGGSSGGTKDIEKCEASMGSLALVGPQDYASQAINRLGLPSPTGLIRIIILQ